MARTHGQDHPSAIRLGIGDIFVETESGEVLIANPLELSCDRIAESVAELENVFASPEWANDQLLIELLMFAEERGLRRASDQVFAAAPHPTITGSLRIENLVSMNLSVWHHICAQIRGG